MNPYIKSIDVRTGARNRELKSGSVALAIESTDVRTGARNRELKSGSVALAQAVASWLAPIGIVLGAYACTESRDLEAVLVDCGDGVVRGLETCDDNNRDNLDGCSAVCRVESGFVCPIRSDGTSECLPECGDGEKITPETCDDNNVVNGDGCSSNCQVETGWNCGLGSPSRCDGQCGDKQLVGGEECDDGNTVGGDGCGTTCRLELGFQCRIEPLPTICIAQCGDGRIVGNESCDDGNRTEGDGCAEDCTLEEGWTCLGRLGEQSSCFECGNGKVQQPVEVCDDNNQAANDGCSPSCTVEPGWNCDNNEPSTCTTICGDRRTVGTEACDDGNTVEGDGCSAICGIEAGWICDSYLNAPSRCIRQWDKKLVGGPAILPGSSSVQADTKILFFGGGTAGQQVVATGLVYDMIADSWSLMSPINAPASRTQHSAVWTGEEMIVFGGYGGGETKPVLASGGRYNPDSDTWTALVVPAEVDARAEHSAVWTGEEMIVFGGVAAASGMGLNLLKDGARFRPDAGPEAQWTQLRTPADYPVRRAHIAVWTGQEMIVHGGATVDEDPNRPEKNLNDTFSFRPENELWSRLADPILPGRHGHSSVWTGEEMIVFGGYGLEGDGITESLLAGGARYNPVANRWTDLPLGGDAPSPRASSGMVFVDGVLMVIGGQEFFDPMSGSQLRLDNDRWQQITGEGAPQVHTVAHAFWTGTQLFVVSDAEYGLYTPSPE